MRKKLSGYRYVSMVGIVKIGVVTFMIFCFLILTRINRKVRKICHPKYFLKLPPIRINYTVE